MLHNIGVKLKNKLTTQFSEVPTQHTIIAKGDSAASKNYWREEDINCLANLQAYSRPSVTLPDGDTIEPSHKININLSKKLSLQAKEATVLKKLTSSSLISLGQICDDDCTLLLNKKSLIAVKSNNIDTQYNKNNIILQGQRNIYNGLWDILVQRQDILEKKILPPPLHRLQSQRDKAIQPRWRRNQHSSPKSQASTLNFLEGLNAIVDINECDYLVD